MNLRADFSRAATSYDSAAVLAQEVGRRLADRLDVVRIAPRRFADIGCATGDGVRTLQRRYPEALPLAIDYALPMLAAVGARADWWARLRGRAPRCVNADATVLPLADGCLDLVWSNLMLHWLPDIGATIRELHRVLAVGGLLHFALLGPDTLKGLRLAAHETGTAPPASTFLDMHDIGDLLVNAGFADPVMEMEMLTLTYTSARAFLADQRRLGVRDALLGRPGWREARHMFAAWAREDGLLPAHFEIIYGHAWKTAQSPAMTNDGRSVIQWHP